ncbi:MAG: glycosyltransferase family 4 protein, partial [Desulfovibrionaceae bacterium]|nr:glycosyltransferase family 4 protein [Desulfovibrionaceae bacterium]
MTNRNLNVLFNTYPMAFDIPGGGESQLMAYYKNLPAQNITPILFDLWKPQFNNVDIVHFFSLFQGSYQFCSYARNTRRLPLVITSSLWITEENRNTYPCDEIRSILMLADCVIANGKSEIDNLSQALDVPREKFRVVYNGIDETFTHPADPTLFRSRVREERPFMLCVGNIEPRKNQLALVRAMKKFPDCILLLVGRVRDRAYAEQCFDEGGNQVVFYGVMPHDSAMLKSAMAACELFVMPSLLETPSLAALEAAAQGARIAITSVGSTAEYFGGMAEYLDPLNVDSIVAAM